MLEIWVLDCDTVCQFWFLDNRLLCSSPPPRPAWPGLVLLTKSGLPCYLFEQYCVFGKSVSDLLFTAELIWPLTLFSCCQFSPVLSVCATLHLPLWLLHPLSSLVSRKSHCPLFLTAFQLPSTKTASLLSSLKIF